MCYIVVWRHRADAACADDHRRVIEAEGTGEEFDGVLEDMADLLPDNVAIDEVMAEVEIRNDRGVILSLSSPRSPQSPPQPLDNRSHSEPLHPGERDCSAERENSPEQNNQVQCPASTQLLSTHYSRRAVGDSSQPSSSFPPAQRANRECVESSQLLSTQSNAPRRSVRNLSQPSSSFPPAQRANREGIESSQLSSDRNSADVGDGE